MSNDFTNREGSNYGTIDESDQNLIVTRFKMEPIRRIYSLFFKISQCVESKKIYLGMLLKDSILLYLGDNLMRKATKEFHRFFEEYWYPFFHAIDIHEFMIGVAPIKIEFNEKAKEYVPIIQDIFKDEIIHVWDKTEQKGQFLLKKNTVYLPNDYLKYGDKIIYDKDVFFYMPHALNETLAEDDNMNSFLDGSDSLLELITPLTSPFMAVISDIRNHIIFESIQISIEDKKMTPKVG